MYLLRLDKQEISRGGSGGERHMRAIVLATSRGEQLDPLTLTQPKALVPIMGRPMIDHILAHLSVHGIHDVVVTLGYQGDQIVEHIGDGAAFGIQVRYTRENASTGTAGAVQDALKRYPSVEPFFVLAGGDALTDVNLSEAYRYFSQTGDKFGLVLAEVEDPRSYRVVLTDNEGRVVRFVEKPGTFDFGRLISTGIYYLDPTVLQEAPETHALDIDIQVFTRWLETGGIIRAYKTGGYWRSIDTLRSYWDAHRDLLDGIVHLPWLGKSQHGVYQSATAVVDPTARLVSPIYIGDDAMILPGAEVGPYTVIGEVCVIGAFSHVSDSLLWERVVIGPGVTVNGAMLASQVEVQGRAQVAPGVVVGEGSRIGWSARLHSDLHLPPHSDVLPGNTLYAHHGIGNDWWFANKRSPLGG